MTKSTITREQLLEIIETDHVQCGEASYLARMALAAMDSEPVAWTDEEELRDVNVAGIGYLFGIDREANKFADPRRQIMLYRHAQQPVVESEPVALQPELAKVIYHFRDWNEGFPVERFKADYVISWMLANYPPAQPAKDREQVRREHAEWSQATFGNVGPVGPLKHLSKEALEAAAEPGDLSEWADMQFLLWDAQRRAGVTDEQITQAMIEKLAVNKQREWPEPKDGEPRLHIKEQPAPIAAVCTCPSGDGSLRWPCPVHPGNSPTQSDCCPAQNGVSPAQGGNSPATSDNWQVEAEKLAEMHGMSFVMFRNGMEPECIDPTKVVLSFDAESKRRFDESRETMRQEHAMASRLTRHRFIPK